MLITEMTKMAEILTMHPDADKVLARFGLCCSSCSGARHESLRQGAINHGLDVQELLQQLNALFDTPPPA